MRDVWRFANTKFARACIYIYIYSGTRWYKRENISANIDREVELRVDGLWNKMNLFRINRPICL